MLFLIAQIKLFGTLNARQKTCSPLQMTVLEKITKNHLKIVKNAFFFVKMANFWQFFQIFSRTVQKSLTLEGPLNLSKCVDNSTIIKQILQILKLNVFCWQSLLWSSSLMFFVVVMVVFVVVNFVMVVFAVVSFLTGFEARNKAAM